MAKKSNTTNKSAGVTAPADSTPQSVIDMLFDKYGVEKLYENSKGEFFTNYNLALVSECNNSESVKTHNKE